MGQEIDWMPLAEQAWLAREQAYVPYSKFAVGAALISQSGGIYSGCNVENASLGLTICAERSAVTAAIQASCRKFSGIANFADTEAAVVPCGACRQFVAAFHPALRICSIGRKGASHSWLLSELLPEPFGSIGAKN